MARCMEGCNDSSAVHGGCRRKVYDETGETDDELLGAKFTELYDYFRAMFKVVTEDDIDSFFVSVDMHGQTVFSFLSLALGYLDG